jgi:hypothetical protein
MSFEPPGLVGIVSSTLRSGFHACADAAPASNTINIDARNFTCLSPLRQRDKESGSTLRRRITSSPRHLIT